jgi:hypothetical protein
LGLFDKVDIPENEKPEDHIFSSIPKSAKQAASQVAESRVTATIKSALQEYLQKYFSSDGCFRNQLKMTAPYAIQYETSLSGSGIDDPTVYEVQLARLWKELKQKLPCILIIDQGMEYSISGLGGIFNSTFISSRTSAVSTKIDVTMTLLIEVAAMDETTCGDLRDLLIYIFGPLTILNKSHLLASSRTEDHWEIRLPQAFEPQGLERKNVEGDTRDSVWTSGIQLTVEFEGTIDFAFANQTQKVVIHEFHEGMIPNGYDENGAMTFIPAEGTPTDEDIYVPDTVYLNRPQKIAAHWIPAKAAFISDDPRVAIVDENGMIHPKKMGKFNVVLMDYRSDPTPLKTWEVRIRAM